MREGADGAPGENVLIRGGRAEHLPSKVTFSVEAGDIVSVRSPGGGGWGAPGRALPDDPSHTG